jgi:hypothetical protein
MNDLPGAEEKSQNQANRNVTKTGIVGLAVISLVLLLLLSYMLKTDNRDLITTTRNTNKQFVYAAVSGFQSEGSGADKPVFIKLNYAHFLPLINNSKLHQVKVIAVYTFRPSIMSIDRVQNVVMKVYSINGTLLRTTSFPGGLNLNATSGKAQLATTLRDSAIKNISASVMFTDSSKSADYSNPLNVKLISGK